MKRYDVDGVHIDDYFYPYPENDAREADRLPGLRDLRALSQERRQARETTGAATTSTSSSSSSTSRRARGEAVGEVRHQPVRHLAARQSAADQRLRRVRADLRRLEEVAAERLGSTISRRSSTGRSSRPSRAIPVLYDWWLAQNTKHRHMWPGLATYRIGENSARHIPAQEIIDEIDTHARRAADATAWPHPLQHDGADEGPGQPEREAG